MSKILPFIMLNKGGGGGSDITDYILAATDGTSNDFKKLVKKTPPIDATSQTSMASFFMDSFNLVEVGALTTPNITNVYNMFANCSSLVTAPMFNTTKVGNFGRMFYKCTSLVNVPVYDTTNAISFTSMFDSVTTLSDESLDNILQMCINATNYSGTKKLVDLGINVNVYTTAKIQSLPHYQDFISAGWQLNW